MGYEVTNVIMSGTSKQISSILFCLVFKKNIFLIRNYDDHILTC